MIYKFLSALFFTFISFSLYASDGVSLYKQGKYSESFESLSSDPQKHGNFYLGVMSYLGKGTDRSLENALEYWSTGWNNRDERSGISLALHLLTSKNLDTSKKGIQILTEVAESGSLNAQYELAKVLFKKSSHHFNLEESFVWFEKAAQQGKMEAQANLGLMYYYGDGIEKDLTKSEFWYTKSAEQGFANAQYALGVLLSSTNQDLAISWLSKAAEAGHIESALTLGDFFQQSAMDYESALFWFNKARDNGSDEAELPIAILNYNSKDPITRQQGLNSLHKCNMAGNKKCLNVLLSIFMKRSFMAQKDLLLKY